MRHVSLLCLWLLHRHNADGASKSTNEHGAHKKGRTKEHNSKELPHVTLKSKEGKPLHVTLSSKERAQQRHDNIVARNQAAQRAEDAEWDPLRRQRAARQRLRHHHAAFVPPSRDAAPLCGSDKFPMRVRSYSQLNEDERLLRSYFWDKRGGNVSRDWRLQRRLDVEHITVRGDVRLDGAAGGSEPAPLRRVCPALPQGDPGQGRGLPRRRARAFWTGAGPGARLGPRLRAAVAGGPDRHDPGDLRAF